MRALPRFPLKALATLVFLGLLLALTDWREGLALMGRADWPPLLLTVLLYPVGLCICALKWRILLRAQGREVPLERLFRLYWAGAFAGNFLPSNLGGDLVRLGATGTGGRLAGAAAAIFMERLTGVAVLLVMGLAALLLCPGYGAGYGLPLLLWALIAGGLALIALGWWKAQALGRLVARFGSGGWLAAGVGRLAEALLLYRRRGRGLGVCLGLSVLFFLLSVLGHALVFRSLGAQVGWTAILLVVPLVSLVSMIPVSINGLGLAEGAFVLFFSRAGVPAEQALAAALLCRLLMVLVSSVGGLFWFGGRAAGEGEGKCG